MNCYNTCKNYCPKKPTYNEFHVDRIVRILESGLDDAVIPQNDWSNDKVTLRTMKQKISWIASSLLELGIHKTYANDRDPRINALEWKKTNSLSL